MTGLSAYLVTLTALTATPVAESESVVLEFKASWCTPCKKMAPLVQSLIQAGGPIREIDVDKQRHLARRFQVQSIPTFILLIDGREVDRTVGGMSRNGLQKWFDRIQTSQGSSQNPHQATRGANNAGRNPATPIVRANNSDVPLHRSPQGLQSSVRLRVRDAKGVNYGSGTIIESRPDKTLILTCGHIFRAMNKAAEIDVEVFDASRVHKFAGHLVDFDLNSDLGLVSIQARKHLQPTSRLAPQSAAKHDSVYSVGCGGGEQPTIIQSQVTALNRYLGPDNVECTGIPVQGRSGGGLFNSDHCLVGVCIAADPNDKRGLYAGLGAIQQFLQRLQLGYLCRPQTVADGETTQLAITTPERSQPSSLDRPSTQAPLMPTGSVGDHRLQAPEVAADIQEAMAKSAHAEVVCIIRPLGSSRESSRVIILNRASEKFVKYLSAELKSQPQPTMQRIPRSEMEEPNWADQPQASTSPTRQQRGSAFRGTVPIPQRYQRARPMR